MASSPPVTGTLLAKGETDEEKIFSTVRLIHYFATFGMIYLFSLAAALTYQCCNENLLSAGTVNQLLGAILFAMIPLIPVYPLSGSVNGSWQIHWPCPGFLRDWVLQHTSGVLFDPISAGPLQRNVNLTPRGTESPQSSGFLNASFQKPLFHGNGYCPGWPMS